MPPPGAPGVSPPGAEIPTEMVDVVIIGAGLSGLTAAIGLTLVGKTVKVIEADCAMEATGTVLVLALPSQSVWSYLATPPPPFVPFTHALVVWGFTVAVSTGVAGLEPHRYPLP